eukprot:m.12674 g.12674  ORF g.12674 m.12674 type:complete len:568 (-) comp5852_c0_seq1:321-2024(-)
MSQRSTRAGSRSHTRSSYRVVSGTSQVDESLFGTASQPATRQRSQMRSNASGLSGFFSGEGTTQVGAGGRMSTRGSRGMQSTQRIPEKPETQTIMTKDGMRTLIVPRKQTQETPLILPYSEYRRIRHNAVVITPEDLEYERKQRKIERDRRMEHSKRERERLEAIDAERDQHAPLSEFDLEAKERNEHLLAKARMQMEEQEDEIKKMNEMIMQAKVYAIRDAQLEEKEAIKREQELEEQRLDQMMELERIRGLKLEEEREAAIKKMRTARAQEIRQQITEAEQRRLIEEELRDQETQGLLANIKKMQQEDLEEAEKKREEARLMMDEVARVNQIALSVKAQRAEAERIEEEKMAEFLKQKAEREDALEQAKLEKKKEKDRELAALLSQQERALDKVAERHALAAKRQAEAVERKRRQAELIKAERQQKELAELQRVRQQQIEAREHLLAMQTQQEIDEFHRALAAQQASMEAEEALERERAARQAQHAAEVRTQIQKHEQVQRAEREEFFKEGKRLDEAANERRRRLDEIKAKKLQQLKAAGIDPKYIVPVQKVAKASEQQSLVTSK